MNEKIRLEGSRFVGWQFYRLLAGGSREIPTLRHLSHGFRINGSSPVQCARGKSQALGYSREPLVYHPFRLLLAFERTKRGRAAHAKAAPLHA
jgi:hypothetical protein